MDTNQNILSQAADEYIQKGYRVALCRKKTLLIQISSGCEASGFNNWDGISIVLERDMVCVDFDTPEFGFETITGDVWEYPMPPSLKEETNRGWHVFYRLPYAYKYRPRIHWKPSVDLLVFDDEQNVLYGKEKFFGHVLCSPTKYYIREYPKNLPAKSELAMAPDWLIQAVSK